MDEVLLNPITRNEVYLAGITGADVVPPSPVTRIEKYLNDILNGAVSQMMPVTRIEMYLAKISGASVEIPAPVTRIEMYLAAIAGMDIETPTPVTRVEMFLAEWAQGGGGDIGELITVTGTAPLTLVNALARELVSLTQYGLAEHIPHTYLDTITQAGKCVQDGTPTPSAPVDIVCNNGVLRYGALGNNLYDPSPSLIELGFYIDASTGTKSVSATNFMLKSYIPVEAGKPYVFYGRAKTGGRMSSYNRIAWFTEDKAFISSGTYTKDRIGTGTAPSNAAYAVLSCNASGESTATGTPATIEYVQSYDWTFRQGTAEVTPFEPFVGGIYADGTPEVLTVIPGGLWDATDNAIEQGTIASSDGQDGGASTSRLRITGYISVKPNTQYTISSNLGGVYLFQYKEDKSYLGASVASGWQRLPYTFTTNESCAYIRATLAKTSPATSAAVRPSDCEYVQVVEGSETVVQTASVVNLFAVGDSADTQELIGGAITRKVGIKVLDGTESWNPSVASGSNRFNTIISDALNASGRTPILCTHFDYAASGQNTGTCFLATGTNLYVIPSDQTITTGAEFKEYLAAQYAAGTPVIVLYPLAEETTETVAPQSVPRDTDVTISYVAEVSDITSTTTQSEHTTPMTGAPLDLVCNNGVLKVVNGQVVSDGTPEVLSVYQNLYDPTKDHVNAYISSNGRTTSGVSGSSFSGAISVEAGNRYTFTGVSGKTGSNNKRIVAYLTDAVPPSGGDSGKVGDAVSVAIDGIGVPYSVTIDLSEAQYADAKYIRFSFNTDDTDVMCIEGSAQTASVENLLSVGDYKDTQDIINGHVTRRVAVCLYDGTQPVGDVFLSTTGGKDNGAIIVYPLAAPTAETVEGQHLSTSEGTNIVSVTAEVSPIELEAKYHAASEQDILSALLGMKVGKKDISDEDAEKIINVILGEENK